MVSKQKTLHILLPSVSSLTCHGLVTLSHSLSLYIQCRLCLNIVICIYLALHCLEPPPPASQFRRCLDQHLGLQLSEADYSILCSKYALQSDAGRVDYRAFSEAMESGRAPLAFSSCQAELFCGLKALNCISPVQPSTLACWMGGLVSRLRPSRGKSVERRILLISVIPCIPTLTCHAFHSAVLASLPPQPCLRRH